MGVEGVEGGVDAAADPLLILDLEQYVLAGQREPSYS